MADSFKQGFIQAPLIKQLQNILQQYPDDGQILKELIQNAEDAGAKTVKFMYDKSKYGEDPDSLYEPGLAAHQGPALYAYNDAVFTEEDWTGLRMIQDSIKAKDPLKVGRFGLGFKSVFHLTDLPGVLSGNQVGYLDPREIYFTLPEDRKDSYSKTSRKRDIPTSSYAWDLNEQIIHEYANQFKPFMHEVFGITPDTFRNGSYRGTLFRFPLRHTPSDISEIKYTSDKVKYLLNQLEKEGHYMILFLKHIEKIEFYEKEDLHKKPQLKFSVSLSSSCREAIEKRKSFVEEIKSAQLLSKNAIHSSYYLETELRGQRASSTDKKQWLVSQYFRNDDLHRNSESLPLVGIALPLNEANANYPKGHVFCFLPMPLDVDNETGMHIHINGYFAVDHNRRHLKWPSHGQSLQYSTDKDLKWNRHLLDDLIPKAMTELLEFSINFSIKNPSFLNERIIYQMFPDIQKLKSNWKPVYDKFVHDVQSRKCLYSTERTWIKPSDAYIIRDLNPFYEETVIYVVKEGHMPLVEAPRHIVEMLSQNINTITPDHVRNVLQTYDIHMSADERKQLVVYFMKKANATYLVGLKLLTLRDGTWEKFKSPLRKTSLWLESSECPAGLVPSINNLMVDCSKENQYYDSYVKVAKSGETQLKVLQPHDIPPLLQRVFSGVSEYKADSSPLYVGKEWLKEIWTFIFNYQCVICLTEYESLPIVPKSINQWHSFQKGKAYIAKQTMEQSVDSTGISTSTLERLGMIVVEGWYSIAGNLGYLTIQDYIAPPTVKGILDGLVKIQQTGRLHHKVKQLTDGEKISLRNAICAYYYGSAIQKIQEKHLKLLQKLPLIKCYPSLVDCNESWASAEEVKNCATYNYTVPLPCKVGMKKECQQFAYIVSLEEVTCAELLLDEVFPSIHQGSYSEQQIKHIMQSVVKDIDLHCTNDETFLFAVGQVPFMSSDNRKSVKPCELIDPSDNTVTHTFSGLDIFPTGPFSEGAILKKLSYYGLMKKISEEEILALAKYLDEKPPTRQKEQPYAFKLLKYLTGQRKETNQALEFLKYLNNHTDLLSRDLVTRLSDLRWVPVKVDKPRNYPKELKWYGASEMLVSPDDLVCMENEYCVSSTRPVLPISTQDINNNLLVAFGWHESPDIRHIVSHLINVIKSNISDNQVVSFFVREIYKSLNEYDIDEVKDCLNACMDWVWTGKTFTMIENVVLEKPELNLEPYLFQMPLEYQNLWDEDSLGRLGICENIDLEDVLVMISKHHTNETRPNWESKRDLKICMAIYCHLRDEEQVVSSDILIPVKTSDDILKLEPMEYCVYCDQETYRKKIDIDDVLDNEDGQEIYEIHEDMPVALAKYIGMSSLIKRYIDADPLPISYGQGEPLTRRIKSLLDDYTDGSSVLKELIQNADDAGASEVSFIYDRRDFSDDSGLLLDENMRPLQGHSLLCHNNAEFTEQDFENIVKISGATKKEKTDKVGRFGLGFNAVYNLTDVPSFVSGSNIVIFDPQTKYLGDTIKDPLQPGIKLNFVRHGKKIQRLKSQFQPFQDVKGCNIQQLNRYKGTLFRFPLRTEKQAYDSEISKKCYNLHEIQGLFSVFQEMAQSILLFTQNVSEVMFYEMKMPSVMIPKGCVKKEAIHLIRPMMVSTDATDWGKEMRVLKLSQNALQANEKKRNHFIVRSKVDLVKGDMFHHAYQADSYWSISNAIGTGLSKNLAQRNKCYIPVGGLAVKLEKIPAAKFKIKPIRTQGVPEGQMFCFLPLPIKSGMSVHINGYFAVSSNRKQLCTQDFGDKDSEKALWNTALMQDPITEAYVSLITDMVEHTSIFENKSLQVEIFNIFPVSIENESEGKSNIIFQLSKSFFKRITTDISICLFPSVNGWTNFEQSKFLDPQLTAVESRELGQVGKAIFVECESVLQRDDTYKLVNLPFDVMIQMEMSDLRERIKKKVIDVVYFYDHIFIPNIKTRNVTNRDKLLLFAILECENRIDNIVKSNCCIPVSSSEGFLKPCQLVDPGGPLKDLYDTEDGPFPLWLHGKQDTKVKRKIQLALQELGMRTCELTDDEIIDRANTIQHLTPEKGEKRCRCLLELLSRENASNESLMARLKPIKILPVAKKPKDWYLSWYADQYQGHFLSMDDAFPVEQSRLVGCSELLATIPIANYSPSVTKALGYRRKRITLKSLDLQYRCVLKYVNNTEAKVYQPKQKEFLTSVMTEIYEHLNTLAAGNDQISKELTEMYSDTNIIIMDCKVDGIKFISPEICTQKWFDGAPFLYSLPSTLHRYSSLWKALGVQDTFHTKSLILALQSIANRETSIKNENTMTVVRNISTMLSAKIKSNKSNSSSAFKQFGDIYLPDVEGTMTIATTLSFNNCPWYHSREKKFLNVKIPFDEAQNLGVKTVRQEMLGKCQKGIPFGQHEKLTNRIKRILDGYPCDKEILKELLQNADDADASEIHFILDYRQHNTEKLFNDEWKSLQGPALLVYNDKPFTQADLEGIQNLGEGSKSFDPLTTGKYGVGFNCVYHLTDTPTFLTADPDKNGDHILAALDPQCKYVLDSTIEYPGQMWNDVQNTQQMFPDVFGCYNLPIETKGGTVFRFPLRTDEMARISDISTKAISTSNVKELFGKFSESLEDCLLFLTNVRKISLSEIRNANGKLDLIAKVKATVNAKGINSKNRFFEVVKKSADAVKECCLEKVEFSQCTYQLGIENSTGHMSEWLVVQQLGFRNIQTINKDVIAHFKEDNACLLPRGGIAYCLGYHHQKTSSTSQARKSGVEKSANPTKPKTNHSLYCFLPLPIEVQFPMHLNGYFALDHESRRNLWVNENMTGFKVEWNKLIFGEVIADSYNTAVEYIRDSMPRCGKYGNISHALDKFCKLFKIYQIKDYYLQYLEDCIYKEMLRRKAEFLPCVYRRKYWPVHNKLPFSEDVDVVWHAISIESETLVYFDELTAQLKEESYISYGNIPEEKNIKKADYVRNVLLNSNFPLIYAPNNLLQKLLTASDNKVKTAVVSPSEVLKFFKTKATLLGLPLPIHKTPFIDKSALSAVLEYCEKELVQPLEGLPMLLTGDGFLHNFSEQNPPLLSAYNDLIPSKQELFADGIFLKYREVENIERYLRPMKCEDMAALLPCELNENNFYGEGKIVKLDLQNDSRLHWLVRLWSFIATQVWCEKGMEKQFDGTQLHHLNKWCIVPVRTSTHEFWPLARVTEVVNINSQTPPGFDKIFRKMSFPEPFIPQKPFFSDDKDLMISTLHHIVANFGMPESVLIALTQAQRKCSINIIGLSTRECQSILQYFNQFLDNIKKMDDAIDTLKQLPFYRKKDRTMISLDLCTRKIYTIPNDIPTAKNWTEESGNTYLERCRDLDELYKFIGIFHLDRENAYSDHILQFLHKFTEEERFYHLKFLKSLIEDNEYSGKGSNARLISVLRSVPLLNNSNGKLLPVSSFYDPNNVVFRVMETNFPRPPMDDDNWIPFLRKLDLVSELTEHLILRYAHEIANQSKITQPLDVMLSLANKSEVLWMEILHYRKNLLQVVKGTLQKIAFLPAKDVTEHWRKLSQPLTHPLFIALNDSAVSEYEVLLWTQRPILPKWVYPHYMHAQNMSELGVITKPSINDVLQNLKVVCDSPQVKKCITKETWSFLLLFLKETFRYITGHHMGDDLSMLQHICCVPILEGTELLKSTQLSMKIPDDIAENIQPYMAVFPFETLGEFIQLFEKAGTTKEADAKQYCEVLRTIYTENYQQELEPNSLAAVLYTLKGLFTLCGTWKLNTQIKSLHMVSSKNTLHLSKEMVYIDKLRFKERLEYLPHPVLFSLEKVKKLGLRSQVVRSAFRDLPAEIKPMFVSEMVTECLEEDCLATTSKSDRCLTLEEQFISDEFANGLIRIVRHKSADDTFAKEDSEDLKLVKKLSNIQFYELTTVTTYLTYHGKRLPKSDHENLPFFIKEAECYVIYLNMEQTYEAALYIKLCDVINIIMKGKTETKGHLVQEILKCRPDEIEDVLDKLEVQSYDAILTKNEHRNYQYPGEYVPIKFHHLLKQVVELLRRWEIVAYEVCDPLDERMDVNASECSEEELDENSVYRYGRVVEVLDNDENSYANYRYKIDLGDDEFVTVHASELYRFQRRLVTSGPLVLTDSQPQGETKPLSTDWENLSQIKNQITEALEEAWKMDKIYKRKVIKRLCLHWHPDKNPDCIKLATEVFKFIQNEIERLEKGLSRSDFNTEGGFHNFNFYHFYGARARSHNYYSNQYDEEYKSYGTNTNSSTGGSSSYFTPPSYKGKNPQPTEARRWMKQADHDLQAVPNDIEQGVPSYEWACFKCHQAAEKALKATQFAVDSALKDNQHTLYNLCNGIDDSECISLARSLESLVGCSASMRYPDQHYGGQTNHDAYTYEKALKAKDYAVQILEKCRHFIQRR